MTGVSNTPSTLPVPVVIWSHYGWQWIWPKAVLNGFQYAYGTEWRYGVRVNVGSLFSGIGGMDLGLARAGFRHAWFCERDPWRRRILAHRWPGVPIYEDIADLLPDAACVEHEGGASENGGAIASGVPEPAAVDLLAGGFPCQPVSVAGKRLAQADERWLWPSFAGTIRRLRPRYVLVENVPGLLARGGGMGDVLGDLARLGYVCEWDCIPASAVGAPHLRYRVWLVAHAHETELRLQPAGESWCGCSTVFGDDGAARSLEDAYRCAVEPPGRRRRAPEASELGDAALASEDSLTASSGSRSAVGESGWWATEPDVGRVAHGVPSRLDKLAGLGDAVVPPLAEWIGRRILAVAA